MAIPFHASHYANRIFSQLKILGSNMIAEGHFENRTTVKNFVNSEGRWSESLQRRDLISCNLLNATSTRKRVI